MIDEFMLDWKNRYKTIRRIVKRNKFIFSLHRRLTDKDCLLYTSDAADE